MKTVPILLLVATAAMGARERSRFHFYDNYFFTPFLKSVSKEIKSEYLAIFAGNLTIGQEEAKMTEWAKKYNRTEEMKKFKAKMEGKMNKLQKAADDIIKALPAAFKEYMDITKREDKTMEQIKSDVQRMALKNIEVFRVLRFILSGSYMSTAMRRRFIRYNISRAHRLAHSNRKLCICGMWLTQPQKSEKLKKKPEYAKSAADYKIRGLQRKCTAEIYPLPD